MRLASGAIERPLYTWLLIGFCVFGGLYGYLTVGKLEDPSFTIKEARIITNYPGASATEVAAEVSEVLESAVQRMDEVKQVTSRNVPGASIITVEVEETYGPDELPQVWDDLRDRVSDARSSLPDSAGQPVVNDDFGDVYGLYYAVTTPGFDDGDIWEISTQIRRELLTVDGVANVELAGLPEEAIFVEPPTNTLTNLGIDPNVLLGALADSDSVVETGTVSDGVRDMRIEAPRGDGSVEKISNLSVGVKGEILNLLDVANVRRGRVDDPDQLIRFNGESAFTLGIAGLTSENIVEVGHRVEARLDELLTQLPVGVELHPIYEQHIVVDEANTGFLTSLALSVTVVIAVLAVFMGWRSAVVVGATLLLTVTATFFFMSIFSIKVERISLGALIIAMGMLVDNAIVVAEGMQTEMQRGRSASDAAIESARRTQLPLFGATVIGIMAFAGIGLSPDATGEFLFSLFAVVGISLLLSWLLALTVTPMLAGHLFVTGNSEQYKDPYDSRFFQAYGSLVRGALRFRWLVIIALVLVTIACYAAFGMVKQSFFPPSNTPIFYLNYKSEQGSSIHSTADDLAVIEKWLAKRDDVISTTSTAGTGFTRFQLTYSPEPQDPSYGQLIIRTAGIENITAVKDALDAFTAKALPWVEIRTERIIFGPPSGADVEARFMGPDPTVLREIAAKARRILRDETRLLLDERTDWREAELVTRPILSTRRAQAAGIDRAAVAQAIALATDGVQNGLLRERDRQIPIIVRTPREEVAREGQLLDQVVYAPTLEGYLPIVQVTDGFDVLARDTRIERRDRELAISVQGNTVDGVTAPSALGQVRPQIEAMQLPAGYRLEWGGEYESSTDAQTSLGRQMPLSFGTMLLITLLLFGKLRQTAVIWTVVPMIVNGVALGLLFTGLPFTFTALLGLLSLAGLLIKNIIVLVEEIDLQKRESDLPQSEAIVVASISRLRPVILAAGTTILGMIPLLGDAFFASMAVTIMAGLGFASVLTLIGVPALYHTYLRAERLAEDRDRRQNRNVDAEKRDQAPVLHTG